MAVFGKRCRNHVMGERPSEQIEIALTLAMTALENQINADARKSERPDNAGKPWEQEEIVALTQGFNNSETNASLAVKHGRTKGPIKSDKLEGICQRSLG